MASLVDIYQQQRETITDAVPEAKITHLATSGSWPPAFSTDDLYDKEMRLRVQAPAESVADLEELYSVEGDNLVQRMGTVTIKVTIDAV